MKIEAFYYGTPEIVISGVLVSEPYAQKSEFIESYGWIDEYKVIFYSQNRMAEVVVRKNPHMPYDTICEKKIINDYIVIDDLDKFFEDHKNEYIL